MLKAGDTVMLVFGCCSPAWSHVGWVGEIESVQHCTSAACDCGHVTHGWHAWITISGCGRGVVPFPWLKKMPPKPESGVRVDELLEIEA